MYNTIIESAHRVSIIYFQKRIAALFRIRYCSIMNAQYKALGRGVRINVGAKRVCPGFFDHSLSSNFISSLPSHPFSDLLPFNYTYIYLIPPQWSSLQKSRTSTSPTRSPRQPRTMSCWPPTTRMKTTLIPVSILYLLDTGVFEPALFVSSPRSQQQPSQIYHSPFRKHLHSYHQNHHPTPTKHPNSNMILGRIRSL